MFQLVIIVILRSSPDSGDLNVRNVTNAHYNIKMVRFYAKNNIFCKAFGDFII